MKILSIILFTLLSFVSTNFEEGFKEGFKQGYCYQDSFCISPLAPLAPLPNLLESSDSYKDGYNRGFVKGREESSR